ncbi:MAG: hypothetical protein ABL999_13410 [Pyrinomonadaceae bacterium]
MTNVTTIPANVRSVSASTRGDMTNVTAISTNVRGENGRAYASFDDTREKTGVAAGFFAFGQDIFSNGQCCLLTHLRLS